MAKKESFLNGLTINDLEAKLNLYHVKSNGKG